MSLDKTFCTNWKTCKNGIDCHRALTKEIESLHEEIGKPLSMAAFTDCFDGRTIESLVTIALGLKVKNPELRYGQSLMNALVVVDKDLYMEITGTDIDPFYSDSKIGLFFERVAKEDGKCNKGE